MMEHQEYQELLALHALDALDAPERRALNEHLATCSQCQLELIELRDAAGLLAHATTPAAPGDEVRARILNQARAEAQSGQPAAETSAPVVAFRPRAAANRWPDLVRLAAALAFVALLLGLFVFWRRDVQSRRQVVRLTEVINEQSDSLTHCKRRAFIPIFVVGDSHLQVTWKTAIVPC